MGTVLHRARHGLICHEEHDQTIGASLSIYGEWAEEEIYFLSSFIESGAVVLDVGANVGTHALAFGRFVTARGGVIAFEAQERVHQLLTSSIILNDARQVHSVRALVGSETGLRFVSLNEPRTTRDFGAVSFLGPTPTADSAGVLLPLPMIKLDDLLLERCDLIKIDVEGMELDVVIGAAAMIARHRPPIYFEQAREQRFAETFELFARADYSLFWHVADPFNRQNFNHHPEDIFGGTKEINVLALPNEKKEHWPGQVSLLQPILNPAYDLPPRSGRAKGWSLPAAAYEQLAPVSYASLARP